MIRHDFTPSAPQSGLIGHRGLAALAPENTLAGFKIAQEAGIDWVEFDLRLLQDGSLVIFHDDALERTSNGKGLLEEKTRQQLQSLDAGSWFSAEFKGEKIPFFADVLPSLLALNLSYNIELKTEKNPSQAHMEKFADIFCQVLTEKWPASHSWPLVSSFQWPLLRRLREIMPFLPIGFLSETATLSQIQAMAHTPDAAFHCHYKNLNEPLINYLNQQRIPFLVYTINDPVLAQRYLDWGAFGVFTDKLVVKHILKPAKP